MVSSPVSADPDQVELLIFLEDAAAIRTLMRSDTIITVLGATVDVQRKPTREQMETEFEAQSADQLLRAVQKVQDNPCVLFLTRFRFKMQVEFVPGSFFLQWND